MATWIKAAKDQIVAIGTSILDKFGSLSLRMSFVGYRDLDDSKRFEIHPFTQDFQSIQKMLEKVKAEGGDDTPEDVHGALEVACGLPWSGGTQVLIHVADAPCHGTRYHKCIDKHPDEPPPDELIR